MALKFQLILLAMAFIYLFSSITLATHLLGGYKVIDSNDKEAVANAKFAVDEHNKKDHINLVFKTVLKAERQIMFGYNDKLLIEATDEGVAKQYDAKVSVHRNQTKFLQLFNPKD